MVQVVSSSFVPYAGYPQNATGATSVTKDIGSQNYDAQRPRIAGTQMYLSSENKENLTWPIIGAITSALSLAVVSYMKFHK